MLSERQRRADVDLEADARTDRALLLEILGRLRVLEAAEEERKRGRLRRGDAQELERIWPVVGGALGSEWFTIRELRASEHVAVQLVLSDWSSRRLGKLFARAVGASIAGFVLEQSGRSHGAACWRVVGEFQTPDSPPTRFARVGAMRSLSQGD